jgi:hypothetical protein
MPRTAFALAFVLLTSAPALAQPPVSDPAPAATRSYHAPAIPIYKSGGLIFGRDGIYPYDSGEYLLSGTEGLARYRGGFAMELPGDSLPAPAVATGKHRLHPRSGLFRR